MSQTFSLQGKLGLDARDFKKGAKQASDAIEDVADELDDLPATGKKAGSETGSLLSSGMTKAFVAAGGAALIAKGLNDAMDVEAGLKRVEAQFALTADEAEKYGELGGELYADAWGESVTDATTSIAKVGQHLQEVGDIADDEMAGITSSVMAVADVFQQDFDSVLRSTGQLVRNELARDAEEALDMITVAFQQGGDRAGDLLDTIDEYSQHWARLGIDGQEALGLIVEGFQQGFRDGDKLADLFKEFGIRALEDRAVAAFEAIGLAGQATQDAIAAGGESARGALDDVIRGLRNIEDPIEQNRIATELFGTQYEDLGPQVLDVLGSIENGLGDVEGAATDMADTVSDTTAASFEELKRRAETALADIAADALPVIEAIESALRGDFSDTDVFERATDSLNKFNPAVQIAEGTMDGIGRVFGFLKDESPWADQADDVATVTTNTDYLSGAMDKFGRWSRDAADEAETGLEDVGDAANDTEDDVDGITDAFQDLRDEVSDRTAYFDVKDAFDDVGRAAEEAADTAGKSLDEQDADVRNSARAVDALRLEVVDYEDQLGGLPEEETTDILAMIDRGAINEAELAFSFLARQRTMWIDIRTTGQTSQVFGGERPERKAVGGPVNAGQGYIVGEEGPEFFVPSTSGMILPNTGSVAATTIANTTQRAMINLTVHSLDAQNAGRVIVDTLEEFYASGGRPL